jgi:hypothetical protein
MRQGERGICLLECMDAEEGTQATPSWCTDGLASYAVYQCEGLGVLE